MPSEPSDGIFNRPPFTGAGRAWKYPNRHSRQYRNLEIRHSRAGGNLDLSVQELIGQNGCPNPAS
ncbi:TPA: hypothetical protein ACE6KZ_002183 [Neisseria gonorrhoeae]|uniref:hypothetical protein n=1 Tax=Neisseria gonorrhoeae TaxID=485 RepID=UPI000B1507D3|nr:hypothetical protein [Neisseria gonorrhoeae]